MAESVTDPLEKAVLSGALFAGPDPEGREPRRAGSPSTSEELSLTDDEDRGFVPPSEGDLEPGPSRKSNGARHRTGPKGVLADYREQQEEKRVEQEHRLNKGMDRLYVEDDHDDEEEREALEAYRRQRIAEMKKMGSAERHQANDFASTGDDNTSIAFGHLREVGQAGFLKAIEETPASVTVVIHVYDPVSNTYLPSRHITLNELLIYPPRFVFAVNTSVSSLKPPSHLLGSLVPLYTLSARSSRRARFRGRKRRRRASDPLGL